MCRCRACFKAQGRRFFDMGKTGGRTSGSCCTHAQCDSAVWDADADKCLAPAPENLRSLHKHTMSRSCGDQQTVRRDLAGTTTTRMLMLTASRQIEPSAGLAHGRGTPKIPAVLWPLRTELLKLAHNAWSDISTKASPYRHHGVPGASAHRRSHRFLPKQWDAGGQWSSHAETKQFGQPLHSTSGGPTSPMCHIAGHGPTITWCSAACVTQA